MNQNPEQSAAPAQASQETFAGITKQAMQQLRSTHGEDRVKAATVPLPGGKGQQWIYRAPERMEYERYMETLAKIRDGKVGQALSANRTLALACTLAPSKEELSVILDKYPAVADTLAEPILKLAGADVEIREETF